MGYIEYSDRDLILELLGYGCYKDYLLSPLWASIRQKTREKYDFKCQHCGTDFKSDKGSLHVHHIEYTEENLKGDSDDGLLLVCKYCHYHAEFNQNGWKRSPSKANKILLTPSKPKTKRRGRRKTKKCITCNNLAPCYGVMANEKQCKRCRREGITEKKQSHEERRANKRKEQKRLQEMGAGPSVTKNYKRKTLCDAPGCDKIAWKNQYYCGSCRKKKELAKQEKREKPQTTL